jgi:uncharacterized protein (DUF305 family)
MAFATECTSVHMSVLSGAGPALHSYMTGVRGRRHSRQEKSHMKRFSFIAAVALIAGCDGATSEKSPEPSPSRSEAMSHDLGPFFQIEMEMVDSLAASIGSSPSDTWVRIMIEHHRGGLAISRLVLEREPSDAVAGAARATIEKLSSQIDELDDILREGPPDEESVLMYRPTIERMHDAMMGAEGADISDTWLRKMREHGRGAIALCDDLLAQQTVPGEVRKLAVRLRSEVLREITVLERVLREEAKRSEPAINR